jgi:hypothetical protein
MGLTREISMGGQYCQERGVRHFGPTPRTETARGDIAYDIVGPVATAPHILLHSLV